MLLGDKPSSRVYILAIVSLLVIVGISFMKAAPELEDAEQAYYSQWWRLGYDDQPPLYTWLQNILNAVLGVSKLSLSLLRAIIFAGVLVLFYRFSDQILKDRTKSALTVFGLVLVPVFIDFTFRRLSHTSLLCLANIATYFVIVRLIAQKSLGNYMALGVVMAIGLLTKYNYILVLAALGMVLFIDRNLRNIVFHRNFLIALMLFGAIVAPHFYWLLGNGDYIAEFRNSVQVKTMAQNDHGLFLLGPLWAFVKTMIGFMAVIAFCLGIALGLKKIRLKKFSLDWFAKTFLAQLAVLLLFFVIMDVNKVEERWLLPLLLPFLALLVRSISFSRIDTWAKVGFYTFLVVLVIQLVRTPIEKMLGIPSSVHFGFEPVSEKLRAAYGDKQWILPDVTYGGSVRLLNPGREFFSLDDFSLPPEKVPATDKVLVVKDKAGPKVEGGKLMDSISDFGQYREKLYFYGF